MNLQVKMEEFLLEEVDAQRLGLGQVVELYLDLIGDPRPEVIGQVGLIQFLKAHGVTDPQVSDLSASWLARFYEYQIQHRGAIRSGCSMRSLRLFWEWRTQRGFLSSRSIPKDLMCGQVDEPIAVRLSIATRKIRG